VDSRLRRFPPDRASAVPMDKPGKTQGVSPTLPTGRRLPNKRHSTPQQHGMILISGNGEISSRLHAFSLFLPESCPNNRDHRSGSLIITRPALSHYVSNRSEIDAGAKSLFDAVAQGVVASNVVKTFPLREAAAAHKFIGGRKTTGSIVMLPLE